MWPFTRRSESRATPLSEFPDSWLEWLGVADAPPVTEAAALRGSIAVARASLVCAGAIASMGWKAHRKNPLGGKLELESEFLDRPSRELTAPELRERIVLDVLRSGAHYSGIERNEAGAAIFLEPLDPLSVRAKRVDPTPANPEGIRYTIGGNDRYTSREIFCLRGPSTDGITGLSLIGVARVAASGQISAERFGHAFFKNNALLSGVLETDADVDEEQADKLKRRFKEKVAGSSHAGEVAVLGGGVKFQSLSMSNEDAQYIETRRFSSEAIFSLFGLGPDGVPPNAQVWLNFTLLPYVRRLEARISRLLPPGQFCELVTEAILRADLVTRYGAYAVGLQNGFLTLDDVCDAESKPRLPGGDKPTPLQPNTGTPNAHPLPEPAKA